MILSPLFLETKTHTDENGMEITTLEGVVESAAAFWEEVNCDGEKASGWLKDIMLTLSLSESFFQSPLASRGGGGGGGGGGVDGIWS